MRVISNDYTHLKGCLSVCVQEGAVKIYLSRGMLVVDWLNIAVSCG